MISIHAPREGGDSCSFDVGPVRTNFNPRPPRGGRRLLEYLRQNGVKFQSTPPARGATQQIFNRFIFLPISIHAPREGGDASLYRAVAVFSRISIHAPREGGDVSGHHGGVRPYHFNPRPPRGGRRHLISK